MNQRDKIIAGLQQLGYKRVPTKSRKYVAMEAMTSQGFPRRVFIGSKGAVRVGKTISESFSCDNIRSVALITYAGLVESRNEQEDLV